MFLITTTHHVLAARLDIVPQFWRIHTGAGLYYGVARDAEGLLYIACRNTTTGPESEAARAAEFGSILVLDRSFNVVKELRAPFPLRDVHGIDYFDDRLWVTCAFDNLIAIYDPAIGDWSQWFPAPAITDRGRDVHHFNTISKCGGEICLVAHHFGPSELLFFDAGTLQLNRVIALGAEAHNVFEIDGTLSTCNSLDGYLVNTAGKRIRTGAFPRGVVSNANGHLVGISMLAGRSDRASQDGILRCFAPDWSFRVDHLLAKVGMVLDILELSEADFDLSGAERWPHVEKSVGTYNRLAPGNRYTPASFGCTGADALAWHANEGDFRWMAAKEACLSVIVNPGETNVKVLIASYFPGEYSIEIRFDERLLGVAEFAEPGIQECDFLLSAVGKCELTLAVRELWQPSKSMPGSTDERYLGAALCAVTLW